LNKLFPSIKFPDQSVAAAVIAIAPKNQIIIEEAAAPPRGTLPTPPPYKINNNFSSSSFTLGHVPKLIITVLSPDHNVTRQNECGNISPRNVEINTIVHIAIRHGMY
jgi:hypothetical protein